MGFFDSGEVKPVDQLTFLKKDFGGDLGQLLQFFRERLGGQDPAVGAAFKLQRPQINRAFDASRRNVERSLVGSGGIRSAARTRRLADVGSGRANALSDAISKITLQRETELPGQLSQLLASLAGSGRDAFEPESGGFGFDELIKTINAGSNVANAIIPG